MEVPDLISEEVWAKAKKAFANHENWVAYNNTLLFVHSDDIHFFTNKEDAREFASDHVSDADNFHVVRIESLAQLQEMVESVVPGLKYAPTVAPAIEVRDEGPGYFPKDILETRKTIIMDQQNLEALQNKIKFLGFDEGLFKQLEEKMKEGKPAFSVNGSTSFGDAKMEAIINFVYAEKEGKGRYFCNNYVATLKGETDTSLMIYIRNKGQNITFRESCNLANGRAVYKLITPNEGSQYNGWFQVNPNQIDEKTGYPILKPFEYDFEVREALGRLPFKELSNPDELKKLTTSLEKGNVQFATLQTNEGTQRVYLEANPKLRTLNMYDNNGNKMEFPLEKVAMKYGMAPVDAARKDAAMVAESGVKYEKKNLLGNKSKSKGLIDKNAKNKGNRNQKSLR